MTFFRKKPIDYHDDFQELLNRYAGYWEHTRKMKKQIKNYKFRPFHNHFLTFKELNKLLESNKIEVQRRGLGLSKIYAEIIGTKIIRVMSIYDNDPESCIIYDIMDMNNYKSKIQKMSNRNDFIDEKEFWNNIILN